MAIQRIYAVYFSATGTTEKVVCSIANQIGAALKVSVQTINFTLPGARKEHHTFKKGDVVIFGTPVYAGRIPNILLPYIQGSFTGNDALAIPVVLYGNRNYDDALIELRNVLFENGFIPVAGAAFIGEHSFSKTLAANRPDAQDMAIAERFTAQIVEKIQNLIATPIEPVLVNGSDPIRPRYIPRDLQGNPVNILEVKPKTNDTCVKCGLCVEVCPMGSIDSADPSNVPRACIKCCACVKKCPTAAKYNDDEKFLEHRHVLEKGYARRAEPELFL
ncbi:MAG: EFR1 family ferrodoxin [Deltaproteobacteria bacterium]|jgi:ferredoxin|nr:EFR1 family ferrodoxin [Deltaproteobacteria bacterium]